METFNIIDQSDKYILHTYGRDKIAIMRGAGVHCWDSEGNQYLDFLCGIGVNVLGHCHPKVVEAIKQQAGKLLHTSNLYYSQQQAELAKLISEIAFEGQVFFANSGAEANEAALKLALKHKPGKQKFLALEGCFHGRTIGALSLTSNENYRKPFSPLFGEVEFLPRNDIKTARAAIKEDVNAFFVEVVQGEGGVNVLERAYLHELRKLTEDNGVLLVVDEVQTGFGKTGKMFAYQHADILPDVMTMAKAIGGGLPMSAVLVSERLMGSLAPGDHATTYGGNNLIAAVGKVVIETIIVDNLVDNAAKMGRAFLKGLKKLAADHDELIREARGLGLMTAIELTAKGPELAKACRVNGLLANCNPGNVLRFLPPLTVKSKDIDEALAIIEKSIKEL